MIKAVKDVILKKEKKRKQEDALGEFMQGCLMYYSPNVESAPPHDDTHRRVERNKCLKLRELALE